MAVPNLPDANVVRIWPGEHFGIGRSSQGIDVSKPPITPVYSLSRFLFALFVFILAVFFLPKNARAPFIVIILLGAISVNPGAVDDLKKVFGK